MLESLSKGSKDADFSLVSLNKQRITPMVGDLGQETLAKQD